MKCLECGAKATEKHHVIPKSLGGKLTVDLCSACHCKIHGFTGNRINAVDLAKLGIYRKNIDSLACIMAWDVNNISTKYYWPDGGYNSYLIFSGDFKLKKNEFLNRLNTIKKWEKEKRWEWFYNIRLDSYNITSAIILRWLTEKHKCKKYKNDYIHSQQQDYIANDLQYNHDEPKGIYKFGKFEYELYIQQNVWNNWNDFESRVKVKRQKHHREKSATMYVYRGKRKTKLYNYLSDYISDIAYFKDSTYKKEFDEMVAMGWETYFRSNNPSFHLLQDKS